MSMMRSMSATELAQTNGDPMEGVVPDFHDCDNGKTKNSFEGPNAHQTQTLDRFARPSFQGEKRKKNFFASFRFSKRTFSRSKEDTESLSSETNTTFPIKEDCVSKKTDSFNSKTRKAYFNRVSSFVNKVAFRVQTSTDVNGANLTNGKLERSQTILGNELIPKHVEYFKYNGSSPALMGLRNHGNTCFINAVIQCLSHTDILAEYFVLDQYKNDLARCSRLNSKKYGTKGEITEQLALLLKSLWILQYTSDVSLNFKNIVEKYEPIYVGSNQHDAAEFLMFVLDKVHEDLNTASKRKYRKVKNSYGRPDDVVAAETLANHLRCNDSFVQAIFQAQFRSSLKCPHCSKESNTFDPYLFVSIPIPHKEILSLYITVVYLNQQPKQVQLGVSIESSATIKELRSALSTDCGISEKDLVLTEIDGEGFHRTFADNGCVDMIKSTDPIYAIELNTIPPATMEESAGFLLITWINILTTDTYNVRFGGVYQSQISRDITYPDLQKVLLKEMSSMVTMETLVAEQQKGVFDILVGTGSENMPTLDSKLDLPLFDDAVEEALSICHPNAGNPHVKFVLKWTSELKKKYIIDDVDHVDEHATVEELRNNPPQSPPVSLNECLQLHTSIETLSCGDAWLCPTCNRKQQVLKRLTLWSAPQILVLHLKRFRQNTMNANSSKLTSDVDFPLCNFDISEHMAVNTAVPLNPTQPDILSTPLNGNKTFGGVWSPWRRAKKSHSTSGSTIYDLYAVCNHHGKDLQGGHYTAACRNPTNSKWYKFDDFNHREISTEDVVTSNAYILFYQKREDLLSPSIKETDDNQHWSCRIPLTSVPPSLKSTPAEEAEETQPQQKETNGEVSESNESHTNGDVVSQSFSSDTPKVKEESHDVNTQKPKSVSPPIKIKHPANSNTTHVFEDIKEISSSAPEPRTRPRSMDAVTSNGSDPVRRQESTPEVRIQPASEEVSRVYRTKVALRSRKSVARPHSIDLPQKCDFNVPITNQSELASTKPGHVSSTDEISSPKLTIKTSISSEIKVGKVTHVITESSV